jgi:hypothetical protein
MQVSVQEITPLYPIVVFGSEHLQEQLAAHWVELLKQVILLDVVTSEQVL